MTADKDFVDKNVVSTGNSNDVLPANTADAYSSADLSRTAVDVSGEKSATNSITPTPSSHPNVAATATLPSYANVTTAAVPSPLSHENVADAAHSDSSNAVVVDNAPSRNINNAPSRKHFTGEPLVIGSNTSNELEVASRTKWVHLSSFNTTVTADNVIAYVAKHASIDPKFLFCFALVKKTYMLSR